MEIRKLEHYNIRTRALDRTLWFYTAVLGLRNGERPATRIPGAWLYDAGGIPVVHVTEVDPGKPEILAEINHYLGHRDLESLTGGGAIDHIAFEAQDYDAVRARCQALDVPCRERVVPGAGLRQIFVTDPNGISIELNFHEAR